MMCKSNDGCDGNGSCEERIEGLLLKIATMEASLKYIANGSEHGDVGEVCTCLEECVAAAKGALYTVKSGTAEVYSPKVGQPIGPRQYMAQGGSICPACGSEDMEANRLEADGSHASGDVECGGCGSTWKDVFELSGYADLEIKGCEGSKNATVAAGGAE
jgi:hypothetical protein